MDIYIHEEVGCRAGAGPGPSPQCRLGLWLLLHNPKAQARTGLVFGLSPQARPQAHPQARPGPQKPEPAEARARPDPDPSPTQARTFQARSGPSRV
jgi:hypothetical protein